MLSRKVFICGAFIAVVSSAEVKAGVPRGLVLSAAEQTADEGTGVTIARGSAELRADEFGIRASADTIEVRPSINEVLFRGRALVQAQRRRYTGETLSCTLDFARCAAVTADQPLPASALGSAETQP